MVKLIIFDLDGTLLDTASDLASALNSALKDAGFPERSRGEVMDFVGNGVRKLIERALPENSRTTENIDAVSEGFSRRYAELYADETKPYPGLDKLLNDLKSRGIKLAVLSNKPDEFTRGLIEKFYPDVFDIIQGSRDGVPRKPDPSAELEIISSLCLTPSETLHVGDSDIDVMTAHNAGVRAIGVTWGYRSRETVEKSGAETVAKSVPELKSAINSFLSEDIG